MNEWKQLPNCGHGGIVAYIFVAFVVLITHKHMLKELNNLNESIIPCIKYSLWSMDTT